MEDAKQLCLLPYARPQYRSLVHSEKERGRLSKLPTWCPDWSTCAWGDYFDIHNHGGFSADKMATYDGSRQGNTILKLDGILVDTIAVVGPLIPDMKVPPATFVPVIENWLGLAKERDVEPGAIWECMHVATHVEVGLDKVDMQAALWEDLKVLAGKEASIQEMKDKIVEGDHQFCWGSMEWADKRAFFVTQPSESSGNAEGVSEYRTKLPKGSVGMALPNVRQGDVLFVIKGGRAPLIFRPLSEESQRQKALEEGIPEEKLSKCYTQVGVSYIHGLMQGQGVADNSIWEEIYLL
jgi:hypothetical protein